MFANQGAYPPSYESLIPSPMGIFEISDSKPGGLMLGTKREVDGRIFRLCKAGATALAQGKMTISPTPAANHQNVTVATAAAVGANTVTVTLGATAATTNQYEDGYLTISDANGEGTVYMIKSNPAADASATLTVTLYDTLHEALTTSSQCCLTPNLYNGTIITVADQADVPAGVPLNAVTASYYYWSCTRGVCPVLADENVAQGLLLTIGSSVVGAVEAQDAAAEVIVGRAFMALVDTEYRPAYLTID